MRQHIEIIGKASRVKEAKTARGWIYSFAVPISSDDRDRNHLTEWLPVSIFQKEQRPELLEHRGEFHIVGELQVKPAWGDRPQKLGLFGFYVEPVLGRVWRVAKKRNHATQQPREGKNVQDKVSEILETVTPSPDVELPLPDFSDEESGQVPF